MSEEQCDLLQEQALALLQDLSGEQRGALGHLLNNALTPIVTEVSFPPQELDIDSLRQAVTKLTKLVKTITRFGP
jgi:hypothetical protein